VQTRPGREAVGRRVGYVDYTVYGRTGAGRSAPYRKGRVDVLTIIIVIILVLLVLALLGRGRLGW
jgi:hypothetical protein